MTLEHQYLMQEVDNLRIYEYLKERLRDAGFSTCRIRRLPVQTVIEVVVDRPGLVIGPAGQNIKNLTRELEEKFGLKNVRITVLPVEVPELDPSIMAWRIARAIERGIHFRKVAFWALSRILEAGALGAEIRISGKLTSERARTETFREGYLLKSGQPRQIYLREAVYHLLLKPGVYGIKVSILPPEAKAAEYPIEPPSPQRAEEAKSPEEQASK